MTCVSMKKKTVTMYRRKRPYSSDKEEVKSGTRPNPSGYTLRPTVASKREQWRSSTIVGTPIVYDEMAAACKGVGLSACRRDGETDQ